jgi:hypothetical protein
MCRLMAYIGPPALVADVVLWPDRSIIKQVPDTSASAVQPPAADPVPLAARVRGTHAVRGSDVLLPFMQSYDARERIMDASLPQHLAHGNLNGEHPACRLAGNTCITHSTWLPFGGYYCAGDGFGIGWFSPEGATPRADPTPCTFTSITPAW